MTIKAGGRSVLILATGLVVFFAGSSQAAPGADDSTTNPKSEEAAGAPIAFHKKFRHAQHHRKNYAHHESGKVALKPAEESKVARTDVAAAGGAALPDLPPTVANANAQLPSPGAPVWNAGAMPAQASDLPQVPPDNPANAEADNQTLIVAADQLNDVDRTLREANPPAATSAMAPANPPPAPVTASGRESSTWDETSLIGKIFIGFGALLTMASAARMFMA
ncbi:MAG: hypothetical protein ACXWKP_25880 [Bradyrhizobium sp.]